MGYSFITSNKLILKKLKEDLRKIAISLISQYGDEAQTIAMLRAAEYAASHNSIEWVKWEEIALLIENIDQSPLDG
jgi:hypothetical protein